MKRPKFPFTHASITWKDWKCGLQTAQNNNGETIKSRKTAEIRRKHALTQHREMREKSDREMREKSDESLHEN